MPLSGTDERIERSFESRYGKEQGKRAYYASINAGKIKNTPEARRMAHKRKNARKRRRSRRK